MTNLDAANSTTNKVVFTAANGKWLDRAKIALSSVQQWNPEVDLWLFTDGVGLTDLTDLILEFRSYGITLQPVQVNVDGLPEVETVINESGAAIRIAGIDFLKEYTEYTQALYIDADVVCAKPLGTEFWNGNHGFVEDNITDRIWRENIKPKPKNKVNKKLTYRNYCKLRGVDKLYFNSGVMRLNLTDPVLDQCMNKYRQFRTEDRYSMTYADQCFLNFLMHGGFGDVKCNIEFLSWAYNFHIWWYASRCSYYSSKKPWVPGLWQEHQYLDVLHSAGSKCVLIHYAGGKKPWNKQYPDGLSYFWGKAVQNCKFNIPDDIREKGNIAASTETEYTELKVELYNYRSKNRCTVPSGVKRDLFKVLADV